MLSASHALGADDAARAKARAFGVLPVAEEAPLDALPLTDAQRDEIERIEAREADRMGALRRALAVTEIELRRAELAEPFDEERVNALVAQQAELRGYLRGAESRVVAEIAALLSDAQRRRLEELRLVAPRAPRIESDAAEETEV